MSAYDQVDREKSERLGRAFNASVYGMLGVPALLLAGLVTVIVRNVRARDRRERENEQDPSSPPPPASP